MPMEYPGEGGFADIKTRVFKRTGQVTLDANGEATISFDPPVILGRDPYVNLTARISSGQNPVETNLIDGTFTTNGDGNYTGVSIQGARLRPLPNPLTLLSQLLGFQVWQKTDASGVKVDWMVF